MDRGINERHGEPTVGAAKAERFATIAEGLRRAGPRPFVVPRAHRKEFRGAHAPETILATLVGPRRGLYGYDATGACVEVTSDGVLADYRNGVLDLNLLDAPLAELAALLPVETKALLDPETVSPVFTRAGTVTPLHVDSPENGGGWMFLATGEKHWVLVDPCCMGELYDRERGRLRDLEASALIAHVDPSAVVETRLGPGEFLFFPPGWMHRVVTSQDAIGIGGYRMRDEDRARAAEVAAWLGPGGPFSYWR